jgi:hypothetical protein
VVANKEDWIYIMGVIIDGFFEYPIEDFILCIGEEEYTQKNNCNITLE